MKCPYCGHPDSQVVDSRPGENSIRRRRLCPECSGRFTTYERVEMPSLMVIKKDGRWEEFQRDKLLSGIRKACAKRPVSQQAIEDVVDDIEASLRRLGGPEVSSAVVGDMVMERLRRLDGVAYIRFASVYRAFADIEDIRREAEAYARSREQRDGAPQLPLFPPESRDIGTAQTLTVNHDRGARAWPRNNRNRKLSSAAG